VFVSSAAWLLLSSTAGHPRQTAVDQSPLKDELDAKTKLTAPNMQG
jgi:hypothetical protein